MCNEHPREDTTGIIRRMAAGRHEALGDLWDRYDNKMARAASVLIRRLEIDESDLDGEGAVNLALFEICRAANRGKLDTITNSDQFWSYFAKILERVIFEARDRQQARKRGGPGLRRVSDEPRHQGSTGAGGTCAGEAFHRTNADLDQLKSQLPTAEDLVLARQDFEVLDERLADPLLVKILTLKLDCYTNVEIGERLDLATRTIERHLASIRRTYLQCRTGR